MSTPSEQIEELFQTMASQADPHRHDGIFIAARDDVVIWMNTVKSVYDAKPFDMKIKLQAYAMSVCVASGIGKQADPVLRAMIFAIEFGYWVAKHMPERLQV